MYLTCVFCIENNRERNTEFLFMYRPDYWLSCLCAYNLRRSVRRLEESTATTDFALASFTIFVDIYGIFLLVIFGN